MSQVCKITEPLCNTTLQQEKKWAPEEVQRDYDYFMAQKAAELLLEKMSGVPEKESHVERLIQPELIIRGSSQRREKIDKRI